METFALAVAAVVGMVVGSFLNVVIWRLPRGESLVRPPSRCPSCAAPIGWRDNVPVLSWLALGGRCRTCGTPISLRYPLVEGLTGALFVLAWLRFGVHPPTAAAVALALAALVAISFIDWDHKIIPDAITKPGIALAIVVAPLTVLHPEAWLLGVSPTLGAWLHAAAGAAVGAGVILAIRILGYLVLRKEAMGLGDVKLLAFVGALAGPIETLYALVLASLGGAVVGLLRLAVAGRRPLRFPLEVRAPGLREAFDGAWLKAGRLTVIAGAPIEAGARVRLRMRLPAAGILEDDDAEVEAQGRVGLAEQVPGGWRWQIDVDQVSDEDRERLALYAASLRYVPFGPFLALGGAATLLWGQQVHWLVTEGYPRWVQRLLGG